VGPREARLQGSSDQLLHTPADMRGLALCALSCSAGLVVGEIVSPGLGKCLDAQLKQKVDAGIKRRETQNELVEADRGAVNVQLYTCHEGFNQDFKILPTGQIQLVGPAAAGKGLCLEAEDLTNSLRNNVRLTWCATAGEVVGVALVRDTRYTILTPGATQWTDCGAADNNVGTEFISTCDTGTGTAAATDKAVVATTLVPGTPYMIVTHGGSAFNTVGAANNNPGTVFVATGATAGGAGTAVAISDAVAATALVPGTEYVIVTTGNSDFTRSDAANSNPGTTFTAVGTAADANSAKQTWILTGLGQLVIGTKCLDVKAEKTADGGREVWSEIKLHEKVNVQLYTCHNPEKTERVNQMWAWQPASFSSTDNWYTQ